MDPKVREGNLRALFNFEGPVGSAQGLRRESEECGGIAQLGEHLLCKQGVSGSNPLISTSGWKKHLQRERG